MRDSLRRIFVALCCGSGIANAQIASSPNYQVADFGIAGSGGVTCSESNVAYTNIGQLSGGTFTSASFECGLGFAESTDPNVPTAPVVFAVTPNYGPKQGGTTVTLSGFNFDKLGTAASVAVSVGGVPASNVQVLSNTTLTFVTPPGLIGPRPLIVSSSIGFTFVPTGFIYAPAVITSPTVMLGGTLEIKNYGKAGDHYRTFVSTSTTVLPVAPYGTLLIGPFPFIELLPTLPYQIPSGTDTIALPVPSDPILSGIVVHFQSLSIFATGFPPAALTNAATTAIQ